MELQVVTTNFVTVNIRHIGLIAENYHTRIPRLELNVTVTTTGVWAISFATTAAVLTEIDIPVDAAHTLASLHV